MATFTMNAQKKFVQAPTSKNIFDKAFVFSIALIVIVGGIWATERVLIYLLDKEIAEYKASTAASLSSLSAENVQKVHDITSRTVAIDKNRATKINTQEILTDLEKSTIPQTTLNSFEYKSDGAMSIAGSVSDYRFLAEQILRYRQTPLFATAEATSANRSDDGQITFDITVSPPVKEESTGAPAGMPMPMMPPSIK